jgi:hypothetical protein
MSAFAKELDCKYIFCTDCSTVFDSHMLEKLTEHLVRKNGLFAPFIYKNAHFTQTGSGQTWETLRKDGFGAQWDRKFFDTTTVQLRLHGMSWADVWLLPEERETVQRLLLLLGEGGEQEGQGGAPAAAKE